MRHLGGATLSRTKASPSRRFSVLVRISRTVKPGRYTLRACVSGRSDAKASCRSKRIAVRARPGMPPPPPGPPPPPPGPPDKPDDRHGLRPPVTGENFYFVMADRFENGDPFSDDGGLERGKVEGSRASLRPARAGTTVATSRA